MEITRNGITVSIPDVEIVRLALEKLSADTAPLVAASPAFVLGQHYGLGIYAGVVRGIEGAPDYHLFVGDERPDGATWDIAKAWGDEDQHGGDIGSRREHRIAFVNVPERFQKEAYWTNEQHADLSGYAWSQYFDYGNQTGCTKDSELRARLFRRLPLTI